MIKSDWAQEVMDAGSSAVRQWPDPAPGRTHRILAWVFGLILALAVGPQAAAAPPPISLEVEGRVVAADPPPLVDQGRTLVPLRLVAEALGAQVAWDPDAQQVTVAIPPGRDRAQVAMVLTIGRELARVGGVDVPLDVPPKIVAGRTFIPLRFVAETLGATVEWEEESRTVRLWRRPSRLVGLTWEKGVGSAKIRMALTEPLLSHQIEAAPNQPQRLVLTLSPTIPAAPAPAVPDDDPLVAGIGLEPDGRQLRLVVDLHHGTEYRLHPSPDGLALVLELGYQVTGVELVREGGVPQVAIRTDGPVPYQVSRLQDPHRLVVDLPGVAMAEALAQGLPSDPEAGIRQIRTGQPQGGTSRLVLELDEPLPYQIQSTAAGLILRFPPHLTGVGWELGGGRTRMVLSLTGPVAPQAELLPDRRTLVVRLPQAVAAVPDMPRPPAESAVAGGLLRPMTGGTGLELVLTLPYYLDHELATAPGRRVVVDLVTSPVYGRRIWLDPGHGGSDPGAIGPDGTFEKGLTLAVALQLRDLLQAAGAQVFMSRTDDRFVDLHPRAAAANGQGADLFLSIHANAALSPQAAGTETYYWENHSQSRRLAEQVHAELVRTLGRPDRGVRQAEYLVLREAEMPAVLVELAFLSNPEEARLLQDPSFQQQAAAAIRDAIFGFFGQE